MMNPIPIFYSAFNNEILQVKQHPFTRTFAVLIEDSLLV